MRLNKRFKYPKHLKGRWVYVPEAVRTQDGGILPKGKYLVISTHVFGITVKTEKDEVVGVEWRHTSNWHVAVQLDPENED